MCNSEAWGGRGLWLLDKIVEIKDSWAFSLIVYEKVRDFESGSVGFLDKSTGIDGSSNQNLESHQVRSSCRF